MPDPVPDAAAPRAPLRPFARAVIRSFDEAQDAGTVGRRVLAAMQVRSGVTDEEWDAIGDAITRAEMRTRATPGEEGVHGL